MKHLFKIVSFVGLGLTVIPAFLVYGGTLPWDAHATLMLVGTLLWFGTAPLWMRRGQAGVPASSED